VPDGVKLDEKEMERAKDVYYALAGWDVGTGTPKKEKLEELGIDYLRTAVK
jgi:aldehyde:ferredoxin oxidoreductase